MSDIKKTIGGDRLGSGKKMKVELHNYERSTHDLGYLWRSTMATGTLVPFMKNVALPGDSFQINLNADVKTLPTVGPLFGSFKLQLDVFLCPIRLYNSKLHMNLLGVGLEMDNIKLPQIQVWSRNPESTDLNLDNSQINPSCILSYLGIKGIGFRGQEDVYNREFNAVPFLAYWDIYKSYYANKQEEIGYVIGAKNPTVSRINLRWDTININTNIGQEFDNAEINDSTLIAIKGTNISDDLFYIYTDNGEKINLKDLFDVWVVEEGSHYVFRNPPERGDTFTYIGMSDKGLSKMTKLTEFPLENIDLMKSNILKWDKNSPFVIAYASHALLPYTIPLNSNTKNSSLHSMCGLGIKTYQSDMFNNWLSTEWIDGENGINAITAIDTSDGSFNIDTLILSRKVYDMLNRIAVSGGSYEDWLQAVYTHEPYRRAENPMYMGGLSKEIVFQEVINNSGAEGEPLGTLAGRGRLGDKHKGGYIDIKVDEPSYIIGIVSITPRVDYSQGNDWDTKLLSVNDLHKPALDQIGFQDLDTSLMHFLDLDLNTTTGADIVKSAGKVPAWLNYMTAVNKCYGEFANPDTQMFMTLNRRYEYDKLFKRIKDLTTYIDPEKFNYIFADARLDAQNFWVQLAVDIKARRKMSAKVMPNL